MGRMTSLLLMYSINALLVDYSCNGEPGAASTSRFLLLHHRQQQQNHAWEPSMGSSLDTPKHPLMVHMEAAQPVIKEGGLLFPKSNSAPSHRHCQLMTVSYR